MTSEERFIAKSVAKEQTTYPHWVIDVACSVVEDESYRIHLQMVNNTVTEGNSDVGYIPKIFNAGIRIIGDSGVTFNEIKLDYFKNSYKERMPIYAVAENTSVKYVSDSNEIVTDNIPVYYQDRLRTKSPR